MNHMFHSATSFKHDISKWDVSKVTDMSSMFQSATSFRQELCGHAWVHSTASKSMMFKGSPGSISQTECHASPLQRWLARWRVASTPTISSLTTAGVASSTIQCQNCGTFKKSGRVSCCATGGTWYKKCGDAGNRSAGHSWLEGVEACKRKSKLSGCRCTLMHIK